MNIIATERKYLFDQNNFDVPDEPEIDPDAPPPPPVFNLEELAQSRDEGFHQGRLTGLEEAQASREQYIAGQLEKIAHDLKGVVLAEKMREKTYESEVLGLCEAIFARAFPALNQREGMSEILAVIQRVLSTQAEQSALIVDVPAGEAIEIRVQLEKSGDIDLSKVEIRDNADLERGSCKINWQNGGALRDHAAIATAIAAELTRENKSEPQQALAPAPQKDDNESMPPTPTEEPTKGE